MAAGEATVGWLGAGRMGSAMAGRLLRAAVPVRVWNRTPSKADRLRHLGAQVVGNLSELATCDIVFVMVSTPADLVEVVLGDGGLLAHQGRPSVIVDCSTVDDATSSRVRTATDQAGVQFLAAPISGNPRVVEAGEAAIVASGPRDTYDRVRPLLDRIGKTSVWAGPGELSRLVKICTNLYLGILVQGLAEVTTLAEKSGVPREAFLAFLNNTVLGSPWTRERTPDLLALNWTATFTTELMRKDFDIGLAVARQQEVPMLLAAEVYQLLQAAIGQGMRANDFLSLFQMQAQYSGLDLSEPAS